ncbi:MAG: hypothetical protein SGPRY_002443 [Prymnesium sp.]
MTQLDPERSARATPWFVWGAGGDVVSEPASEASGLGELSSSYGWCLLDSELKEMQSYQAGAESSPRLQEALTNGTSSFLAPEEIKRLCLAVEVAYQSRAWSTEERSDARLRHAVSCALVLADIRMEAEAIIAALLVGVCEDTGLSADLIDKLLGPSVSGAVRDVTNVWRLSSLLANSPSGDAEQLEDRCKILLAGCDDWRGVVVSLASRLVAIKEMQEHLSRLEENVVRADEKRELSRKLALQTLQLEEIQRLHAPALQESAQLLRKALKADPFLSRHVEWLRVQARTKAAYSAYTKMQRKGQTLDELYDVLAIRVIFRPIVFSRLPIGLHRQRQCMLCYRVRLLVGWMILAGIAQRPKEEVLARCRFRRVKDYVTYPKPNGYQSIHSTLQLGSLHAELQIRTAEMHRFAEHGKASHWLYKESLSHFT